ncbi:hypothetical protein TRFO_09164 [Tritrichomonas foetus]|uniref:Myb-like DNA-binding domain containing protein n=1 Tax=Tritrichomonas foetus TaxID=1144522 RepID=A0A1J4JH18_9EUKA|nr:hypothetical protein TRFO_09164 [Tritrichomonas foetus]|eukprot:OHS97993.1 hypothetical protein TRFO_09164 [Tritrichomonas foetus]
MMLDGNPTQGTTITICANHLPHNQFSYTQATNYNSSSSFGENNSNTNAKMTINGFGNTPVTLNPSMNSLSAIGAVNASNSNSSNDMKLKSPPKLKFTPEEDDKLLKLVQTHGSKNWITIAQLMETRNPRQCRERWNNYLNPDLRKDTWSKEEDDLLDDKYSEYGPKWNKISKFFLSRSDNNIRNRWMMLARHRAKAKHSIGSSPQSSSPSASVGCSSGNSANMSSNVSVNISRNNSCTTFSNNTINNTGNMNVIGYNSVINNRSNVNTPPPPIQMTHMTIPKPIVPMPVVKRAPIINVEFNQQYNNQITNQLIPINQVDYIEYQKVNTFVSHQNIQNHVASNTFMPSVNFNSDDILINNDAFNNNSCGYVMPVVKEIQPPEMRLCLDNSFDVAFHPNFDLFSEEVNFEMWEDFSFF